MGGRDRLAAEPGVKRFDHGKVGVIVSQTKRRVDSATATLLGGVSSGITSIHLDRNPGTDSAFLRSVLAASGDCIKVLDLEGRVAYMNDGGQALMEVSDFNSIKGCPWPNFWEGEGHEDARRALQAGREGRTGRFQGEAKTFKGNAKWWDVQVTPIFDEAGRPRRILSVSRDITQAKLNELEVAEQEANYRNLYNAIAIGFCIVEVRCNDQGAPEDYRFLKVNKAFGEITGLTDITGRWMGELAPQGESPWAERYAEMVARVPLGRFGDPELDIGRPVAWLVSEEARYITGSTITLDGGQVFLR